MDGLFQKAMGNELVMGVVSLLFGIVLIVGQAGAVAELVRILGILLLIGALVALAMYFAGRESKGDPAVLALAVAGIFVSLVFIYAPEWLIVIFPVVMGIVLIVSSVLNIATLAGAPARTAAFPAGTVLSVVTLVLGVVILLQPMAIANVLIVLIGVAFLVNGVIDLMAASALR